MPAIDSRIDPASEGFRANRAAMLALIEQFRALEQQVRQTSNAKKDQFAKRGQLLPRERVALLLDRGSPFLELSTLAGLGMHDDDGKENPLGGGVIDGIGYVSGVRCLISASDSAIKGGTTAPMGLKKKLRCQEIARDNKLPLIQLVESGGANLNYQAQIFVEGGQTFRNQARLSAAGIPQVTVVHGSSTAGGAYLPGLSDYVIMVKGRAKVFLAGPPLLRAATGEIATDEALGGAEMHSRVSGLSDYFAIAEHDAIRLGRAIMARINWRKHGPPPGPAVPPRYDPDEILGIVSADVKVPFDPREILARVVDGSEFDEYKPLYGTSLVTGWARLHGYPVGVLANHRGVLFSEEAKKASEFILLANSTDTPLVFLQNTTGYMVGASYEQGGIIKDGAKMINAVTNSAVPHLTVTMASSFGAGNYGMSGRGYDPRFLFAWPGAKLAVMGAAQLAGVLSIVGRASAAATGRPFDEEADRTRTAEIEAQIEAESHSFFRSEER